MRSLLLIAAVLVAGALALDAGQQCEPGSTFKMDCNTCRCSADGKVMSCTRKFCIPEVQGDDPKAQPAEEVSNGQQDLASDKDEEHVHTNGQVCTPNEVKMEDCNRCKCAANGIGWFCTRKTCPPRERRSANDQRKASECTPGTSFKSADGCNDCFCSENGIAACTMKFCFFDEPAQKTKRDVSQQQPPKQECVPGSTFKSADGCNDCFCTENGIAACTMKFCFPLLTKSKRSAEAPAKQCEPGTTFKHADGCNDCSCTETGHAICTAKFCFENPRTKRQVAKADKQCVPGTSFKSADGCNDCFCGESGIAACTMKFCFFDPPVANRQKRDADEKCVPGTQFMDKDGCNTCFCTETGHAACTEKLCLTDPRTRRQTSDNGELPVSEIAPGAPGFTCNAGKSFKYQCNTCRCDTTGQSAACTFKFCVPGDY